MGLDIKFPIGLMFLIFGIILGIFGITTTNHPELYVKSLEININLWSGLFMTVFGLAMLIPSLLQRKK